jgi:hypothetical protein
MNTRFKIHIVTPKLSAYIPRGITARRLYHANKYIEKKRQEAGLFADEFCAGMDAEQRILDSDQKMIETIKEWRKSEAKSYWEAKKLISKLSPEDKKDFFKLWNRKHLKKVTFALDMLYRLSIDKYHFKRALGERTSYTQTIIRKDGKQEVVEISKDEYYANIAII